ncbi:MAG: hypothetical protein ABIT38_00535, partial [Gemmatimonadaceae bacterium]
SDGGSFVWAWDLSEDEEPNDEDLQRADGLVVDAKASYQLPNLQGSQGPVGARTATPSELAQITWDKRPRENARLIEASTRAFHAAARMDNAVAAASYEEVS